MRLCLTFQGWVESASDVAQASPSLFCAKTECKVQKVQDGISNLITGLVASGVDGSSYLITGFVAFGGTASKINKIVTAWQVSSAGQNDNTTFFQSITHVPLPTLWIPNIVGRPLIWLSFTWLQKCIKRLQFSFWVCTRKYCKIWKWIISNQRAVHLSAKELSSNKK